MKKQLIFGLLLSAVMLQTPIFRTNVSAVAGQWSSSSTTIYYNDGNVGIGATSPAAKLHVGGDFLTGRPNGSTLMVQTPASDVRLVASKNLVIPINNVGIGNLSPRAKLDVTGDVFFSRPNGSQLYIQTPSSDVRFYSATNKPILLLGGNIGIGTYNPTKTLSVNGTVLAREILVSNVSSNWPDYVFDDNYELKSLTDLEKFIKENNHLPNIPSAEEISNSEGVSIGEMQRLQLEKIEELTLHLIQKDKEINSLEERLSKLEALLNK